MSGQAESGSRMSLREVSSPPMGVSEAHAKVLFQSTIKNTVATFSHSMVAESHKLTPRRFTPFYLHAAINKPNRQEGGACEALALWPGAWSSSAERVWRGNNVRELPASRRYKTEVGREPVALAADPTSQPEDMVCRELSNHTGDERRTKDSRPLVRKIPQEGFHGSVLTDGSCILLRGRRTPPPTY
ncbi:hypothetical protein J6590_034041 [Homalodisca vitripennis]|nr:hypothetical protein J6590_034041 [Homalodisca vitripennis]